MKPFINFGFFYGVKTKVYFQNAKPQTKIPHSLIVGYRLDNLISAQKELNKKTNVASLKGCASRIAKDRKRYIGSVKINDVRNDVAIAINEYNSFIVNKEQLDEQDTLDKKARDEWEDKVRKNGILLDIQ